MCLCAAPEPELSIDWPVYPGKERIRKTAQYKVWSFHRRHRLDRQVQPAWISNPEFRWKQALGPSRRAFLRILEKLSRQIPSPRTDEALGCQGSMYCHASVAAQRGLPPLAQTASHKYSPQRDPSQKSHTFISGTSPPGIVSFDTTRGLTLVLAAILA